MPNNIHCTRCGQENPAQAFQPLQTPLGQRAFREICASCWAEWTRTQQQLINHYALNVREQKARDFLYRNMEQFLFEGGGVSLG